MAIKKFKPTSPGRRQMTSSTFEEITTSTPEKSLLVPGKKSGGRNNAGRITQRHTGGGHKQRYRLIDFKRDKKEIPAKVATIEYDPNRSARIALLNYADGEKRYILAPVGINVGDQIIKRPLITEKSNLQREAGQTVTFEVARDANKIEIKQAIEKAFKVKVKDVRTMVTAGKAKRVGRTVGKRSAVKKAYVTLAEGTIDFFGV